MQTAATHSSSSVFLRGESLLQRHGRTMRSAARQSPVRVSGEAWRAT